MDLTNLEELQSFLKKEGLWLKKRLGQHFLVDKGVLNNMVQLAAIEPTENVLEIGPGIGTLTERLVVEARKVIAFEIDPELVQTLRRRFVDCKNLVIKNQDVLGLSLDELREGFENQPFRIISNLPYQITSPILRTFLSSDYQPKDMYLMIQKEVAERITAHPGSSERGILTLLVEFYGEAEILEIIPPESFWPKPEVDSAVVRIILKELSFEEKGLEKTFFRVVKAGFGNKRRQIHNSLAGGLGLTQEETKELLENASIDLQARAEDLTKEDWLSLSKLFIDRNN